MLVEGDWTAMDPRYFKSYGMKSDHASVCYRDAILLFLLRKDTVSVITEADWPVRYFWRVEVKSAPIDTFQINR